MRLQHDGPKIFPVAFAMAAALAAAAQPSATAHVRGHSFTAVVAGRDVGFCGFGAPMGRSLLLWVDPHVAYPHTDVRMVDSADGRTVLASVDGAIVFITPGDLRTPCFDHPTWRVVWFAVAPNGRVFAVLSSGVETVLGVLSPAGVLEATHPYPEFYGHSPPYLWDAGDDCMVLFPRNSGSVGRMNACTGALLTDLVLSPHPSDIEPLPNGDLLVATDHGVRLYDRSGTFLRNIPGATGSIGQVAISRDGRSVWYTHFDCFGAGLGRPLFRVPFDGQGQPEEVVFGAPSLATSLVVGDVYSDLPAATPAALLVLALTLAFAAVSVLRR